MPDRLKVLFITSWYPDTENPIHGIFVREHAKAVEIYDDITVLHLNGYIKKLSAIWQLSRDSDHKRTSGIATYHFNSRLFPVPGISYLIQLIGILFAIRIILKGTGPIDIIHAHIYHAGVVAIILGKLYHLPVIITEHNSAFPRRMLNNREIFKARFAFMNAKLVLPVSYALQMGIEQYKIKAHYKVVPNAFDSNIFFASPNRSKNIIPKCLFVGSMIPVKGINYMIQALALIKHLPWTLDLIGDGKEVLNYQQLSKSLGIENQLTFHGNLSHEMVAEYMRQADLLILPSLWENLPCVLIEAQACGLPIIASNVGGIPEIVTTGTGWLAEPGNVVSLSNNLSLALNQIDFIDRKEISDRANKYSKFEIGQELHNLYLEVRNQ